MEFKHYSVLLDETIEYLNIKPDGIYVDGTLGGGGHAFHVCKRLDTGRFYGIDQDDAAIAAARRLFWRRALPEWTVSYWIWVFHLIS